METGLENTIKYLITTFGYLYPTLFSYLLSVIYKIRLQHYEATLYYGYLYCISHSVNSSICVVDSKGNVLTFILTKLCDNKIVFNAINLYFT